MCLPTLLGFPHKDKYAGEVADPDLHADQGRVLSPPPLGGVKPCHKRWTGCPPGQQQLTGAGARVAPHRQREISVGIKLSH